ncbi:arabinogalactan endo-beta-1,4-galactanase [Rhizocola hellebori]|uniref:Arabinogalactan endo-beta-1,4-galactanase n=1 Tax=Rhizocola hellebori TaxID=1392758 RepID=A0A8J3VKA2_9ACTN|nr:arabinogalactan endo-1,4-beta-galactosidase [Rhizocola hellebori]GIH10254.1 arabinogalactan endo-beta-1,4-galactanase [Rhizocola hellebori]
MLRTRIRLTVAALTALATVAVPGSTLASPGGGAELVNPGFETGGAVAAPVGWAEHGEQAASFTEPGGHSGALRLTHYSAQAYQVVTSQRLQGLRRGTYTLRAWVRSSGNQNSVHLALTGCGGSPAQVAVPRTGPEWWVQIVLSTRVEGGRCTIAVSSDAAAGDWLNVDDLEFTPSSRPVGDVDIQGADVSQLAKNETYGAVYRDARGRPRDALQILKANGVNYLRLKVWVDSADDFHELDDILTMARRAKAQGMKLLVDFHYSDAWADPGKQNKPASWASLPFEELKQALYDHTYQVLAALRAQHTPADMAQLGNEINGGMLWPDGRWDNWDGLAALLTAGGAAVRAASPGTKVVLHLAEGGNNGGHVWWFDNAIARGVTFDIIAVSQYVYWHGPLGYLQANLFDLVNRYGKDVMVVETAYGFTTAENDHETNIFNPALAEAAGYPATPEGQTQALRDMFNVVAAVPNGHGLGVFYWEPTWTAVAGGGWDPADPASGDGWENQALFDYSGRALPALRVFADF